MAGYRVFDIETVVDPRFWSPGQRQFVEVPATGLGGVLLQASDREGRIIQETEWMEKEQFPPPQAHRVVSISTVELSANDDEWYKLTKATTACIWSHGDDADDLEKHLLQKFGMEQEADEAILVTWNGRTFDLPVINMRSFLHGVACPWYYKERDTRYRYSESGHCDLMDVFSDYGAARSMKLGDVAKLVGLPGKVGPVSGANVGQIYSKGDDLVDDMSSVARYCLGDSLQTALLFARSRVHKGMIDVGYYNKVVLPSFLPELERVLGVKESDLRG